MSERITPFTCVICGTRIEGEHGHNAALVAEGPCCTPCNARVIEERMRRFFDEWPDQRGSA